jgi:paraquat-inducible protein A
MSDAGNASGLGGGNHVPPDWRECPQCGLISKMPVLRSGFVADCPRCRHGLWRMRQHPFNYPIACGLAASLFYGFSLVAPFLEISAYGRFQLAKIATGPAQLLQQGFAMVGLLVLAVTVIFPGIKLGIMLVTLIGIETRFLPARFLKAMFRWYEPIRPWAMIDVYLLGFLVAYTRLIAMASVHLDTALYSLIGLMISMAAADSALDAETVWRALDLADKKSGRNRGQPKNNSSLKLIGCHCCDLVNRARPGDKCSRCHATLHIRKADSIGRSWAFLIAAALLYVPANIFPVMTITELGQATTFTIMGGIVELINAGLWPLALLVFFASITIPLMKLLTLGYMLLQTQMQSSMHLLGRTRAFRIIEFVGRLSMIDVFMISILVALVRFGQFTNIQASAGAPCFAAVVVLTMFAVDGFDSRLMWDATKRQTQKSQEIQAKAALR